MIKSARHVGLAPHKDIYQDINGSVQDITKMFRIYTGMFAKKVSVHLIKTSMLSLLGVKSNFLNII